MKTKTRLSLLLRILPLGLAVAWIGVPSPAYSQSGITPEARALAKSVEAKLGAAQTIRLNASHRLDPALGVGSKLENGAIHFTVERPNRFYAIQPAGRETREIAYDGRTFVMMHPKLKHHAIENLPARSVSDLADRIEARFGFRPPVAELLAGDFSTQIFRYVTSATVTKGEKIGFTACDRLHFVQPGMTGDLWVGVKDGLPRRYRLTFTDTPGHPAWEVDLKQWKLNVPVDSNVFSKRPAADSMRVPMVKSR
jgi:hypothetical protein